MYKVERGQKGKCLIDIEVVKKLLMEGKNQSAIASELGCAQGTIAKFMKDNGLKRTEFLSKAKEEDFQARLSKALELYQQGYSIIDAAMEGDVGYHALRNKVHELKIARKKGRSPKRSTSVTGGRKEYPFEKEALQRDKKNINIARVCPMCGKEFYIFSDQWAYRAVRGGSYNKYYTCTYTCSRKAEKGEY